MYKLRLHYNTKTSGCTCTSRCGSFWCLTAWTRMVPATLAPPSIPRFPALSIHATYMTGTTNYGFIITRRRQDDSSTTDTCSIRSNCSPITHFGNVNLQKFCQNARNRRRRQKTWTAQRRSLRRFRAKRSRFRPLQAWRPPQRTSPPRRAGPSCLARTRSRLRSHHHSPVRCLLPHCPAPAAKWPPSHPDCLRHCYCCCRRQTPRSSTS